MDVKKILKKLDGEFTPKFFNRSDIDEFLKNNEKKVIIVLRTQENQNAYENFDKDFSTYLGKLPNSPLKKSVGFVFNKNLIYYGTSKNTEGVTYSRVLVSKNDKLAGIVLNAYALDIAIRDGNTPSIDECIYAAYYGLIRAATIIFKQEIIRDRELQKQITNFLYILMLKILGKTITINQNQKKLLQMLCIYLFCRQFLEEKQPRVISIIRKNYSDLFNEEDFKIFEPYFEKLKAFDNFKDLPRIVHLLNIADANPSQMTMMLIRSIGASGFHTLIGTLDNLVASIVLNNYPTDVVSRGFSANAGIQESIENHMINYVNKITYDDEFNALVNSKSSKGEK